MRVLRITQTWGLTPEALVDEARHASPRVAERLHAVRWVWQGYPTATVSAIIGRHPGAVRRYVRAWNAQGPAGLGWEHAPGGRRTLTAAPRRPDRRRRAKSGRGRVRIRGKWGLEDPASLH